MGFLSSLARLGGTQPTTASERSASNSKYRGVQINGVGNHCCEAVHAIAGKRFLSMEVPKLPLSGCTASDCRCIFELFDDRRTDIRRASDVAFDLATELWQQDGRSSPGRRHDD